MGTPLPTRDYGVQRRGPGVFLAFTLGVALAAVANAVPWLLTRGDYRTDGCEIAGFPLSFYRRGGFQGIEQFMPVPLAINAFVAFAFGAASALAFRAFQRRHFR